MIKRIVTDKMILATMLSTVFFSACHPSIHKYLMMSLSERYLAIETIIFNIGVIFINYWYDKHGDKIFPHYPKLLLAESILYTTLIVLTAMQCVSVQFYFITDVFIRIMITRNIICCANRLKRIVHNGESREKFDNTVPVACAVACCTGASIAFIPIPLWLGWLFMAIGVSIDNLFYYLAYKEHVK